MASGSAPAAMHRLGDGPGLRLLKIACIEAGDHARDLGQKIRPSGRQLAELGHRGSFLLLGQRTPFSVMLGRAVQLGDEDPVRHRSAVIVGH